MASTRPTSLAESCSHDLELDSLPAYPGAPCKVGTRVQPLSPPLPAPASIPVYAVVPPPTYRGKRTWLTTRRIVLVSMLTIFVVLCAVFGALLGIHLSRSYDDMVGNNVNVSVETPSNNAEITKSQEMTTITSLLTPASLPATSETIITENSTSEPQSMTIITVTPPGPIVNSTTFTTTTLSPSRSRTTITTLVAAPSPTPRGPPSDPETATPDPKSSIGASAVPPSTNLPPGVGIIPKEWPSGGSLSPASSSTT